MLDIVESDQLIRLVATLVGAALSWFAKDVLLKSAQRKEQEARSEWKHRLTEVWDPLFFWSGIVFLSAHKPKPDSHGVKEFEMILAKAAHLMPRGIFHTYIRLIEQSTGQKTTPPSQKDILDARNYVYRQIEVLNFLLYQRDESFHATSYTDVFGPLKRGLRAIAQATLHLVVWLAIFGLLAAVYWAATRTVYWPAFLVLSCQGLITTVYFYKRRQTHRRMLYKLGMLPTNNTFLKEFFYRLKRIGKRQQADDGSYLP